MNFEHSLALLRILSSMFVCAISPLITDRLSEECQENRELIQPTAY